MNLNALEQDLYRRLGFATASPDTATQTRLRAFLNETQQDILSEPGMEALLYDTMTFASVASQPTYGLPPAIARIRRITDQSNRIPLSPLSMDLWRTAYPSPTAVTGISDTWVDLGLGAVATQPTAACELFAISTAAGDTGGTHVVYVEGYRTGGVFCSLSVQLNGVTAVSLSAAVTDWIEVTKFYTGTATAVGDLTLRQGSGIGTVLATIGIGNTTPPMYRRIALAICPASAIPYTVDFERDVTDLSIATDTPVLPARFHRLLGAGARRKEYEKQKQADRYAQAALEYAQGLRQLKYFVFSQAVGTPNLRGATRVQRPSQLGAWYPAGS